MSQQINKSISKKQKKLSDYEKGLIIGGALHDISLTTISEKTGIPMTTRDLRQLKNEMKKDRNATLGELVVIQTLGCWIYHI
ncbi:hypothetical protein PHYBLDRAFT_142345 [Phycomyces blakesleeanus NRRL 1555(-)]|uniref:Homeodomain-like DNA binding domain-containing transcription factor n=1 Tax=Phycomyces blakesleeanus (strain ATCC 8743b / DSM 1359 / FGSC 10004 / NBRC 33097 / NRRL 1555) TaxID=763407 RepID=A0A167NXR9_PHYB8|nr:hypothetical protein PHYBLDRAFT_142345 [Phycomyces blakesleeanus NRRL 1555(-)]OAD76841.1 hypothetical protein PHYBLDRAFT_142345 [Phycomyces blakesleeanus NRRL 1555(-)]|eukprot:XP_018294881.1 hypothetical protein PHYBLDRAFT_142345 [Phycomyces blakesleeanus NRRL 1555(-)]